MSLGNTLRNLVVQIKFQFDKKVPQEFKKILDNTKKSAKNLGSAIKKTGKSTKDYTKTVSKSTKALEHKKQALTDVRDRVNNLRHALSAVGRVSMLFTRQLVNSAKAAAEFEKLQVSFEVMAGSVERGKLLMADLTTFAGKTPFLLNEVRNNALMLTGMGFRPGELVDTMDMLGNITAGLPNLSLERLALNYGQVKAQGYLTGREWRDFAVGGVDVLGELAKEKGKTLLQLRKMMEDKQISFSDVEQVFKNMTSEGGRFYELMKRISRTSFGLLNNIKVYTQVLKEHIGKGLLESLKPILAISKYFLQFRHKELAAAIIEYTQPFVDMLVGLIKIAIPLGIALSKIVKMIGTFFESIGRIANSVFGLEDVKYSVIGILDAMEKTGDATSEVGDLIDQVTLKVQAWADIFTIILHGIVVFYLSRIVMHVGGVVSAIISMITATQTAASAAVLLRLKWLGVAGLIYTAYLFLQDFYTALTDPAHMRERTFLGEFIDKILSAYTWVLNLTNEVYKLLRLLSFPVSGWFVDGNFMDWAADTGLNKWVKGAKITTDYMANLGSYKSKLIASGKTEKEADDIASAVKDPKQLYASAKEHGISFADTSVYNTTTKDVEAVQPKKRKTYFKKKQELMADIIFAMNNKGLSQERADVLTKALDNNNFKAVTDTLEQINGKFGADWNPALGAPTKKNVFELLKPGQFGNVPADPAAISNAVLNKSETAITTSPVVDTVSSIQQPSGELTIKVEVANNDDYELDVNGATLNGKNLDKK